MSANNGARSACPHTILKILLEGQIPRSGRHVCQLVVSESCSLLNGAVIPSATSRGGEDLSVQRETLNIELVAWGEFHRGDPNQDGTTNLLEAVFLLKMLFRDGEPSACEESADIDDDASLGVTDTIGLLEYLFNGGPPPAAPGPPPRACGVDPVDTPGNLGCTAYRACAR